MLRIAYQRTLLALLVLTALVNFSEHQAGAQTSAPQVIILNSYHPGFTWSDEEVSGVVERLRQQYPESTRLFTEGLKIPAFAIKAFRLGYGIVGGVFLGGKDQGLRVGDKALRVLAGEDPEQIPVDLQNTAVPGFDYRQLKRFHIPLSALPAGSLVINRPLSFNDQYKPLVWGTISVITALTTVILLLSINIMRRRQAETALQESEVRLHMAQEAAGAGSWDWRPGSGEMIWSPENYLLLGLTPNEGKPSFDLWLQCLHPDDRENAIAALNQALKEKEGVNIEYRVCRGGTDLRWLNGKGRIYRDETGAVVRLIGANIDITERRRTEEELRLKEKLLDGASDSIFLHDQEGHFLYLNEAAYKSRGYEKEELMDLNVLALPAPEFLQDRPRRLQELQTQRETIFETAHRRKDGSLMPVEIHARLLDLDDRQLILSVARDITKRKIAEKALVDREKLYHSLFENMLNGFAYCRMLYEHDQPHDFIYLEVNKSFETLTGLKNVVGKKVSEVIPGIRESNPELFETYNRVALTGTPEKFETYISPLGMWLAISVYSPTSGYFTAIFEVITTRKQAEEALQKAAHQWRTTFDAISDAVCLLDRNSRIIQSNRAMADLAGQPQSGIIGRFCWEVLHETGPVKSCPLSSMWRSRRRQTLTLPRGNRWLHVMVDPILDESAEITGAVHIVSDITTQKRSQDKIRDLNILLRAIKNINEALLRARSESELFQQI
ncbi:MAG: PAS domain S-box protein, partial [Deltaproteobacteria bacterium]|nr:PAS domain S-box protein [Deltaproteobacteria bacterium]